MEPETSDYTSLTGDVRVLDPRHVKLFRNKSGTPCLTLKGELSCLHLQVKCAFPLSRRHEYVSLRDGNNAEIGLIENLHDLDRDSRRIAEEEIERRYFLPEITAIRGLNGHFGTYDWDVETDRGPRTFHTRGRSENIVSTPPHRVLITDVLGNRYKISDTTRLDRRSAWLLTKVI